MPGISFILIYVLLVAISKDVFAEPNMIISDYELSQEFPIYWDEDPSDRQNSKVKRSTSETKTLQECSCTYDYSNGFIKARLGHRLLEKGDSIMQGETVSFECRYLNTVLTWENGLRFYGRANMTCNTCEKWESQHLPTCRSANQINVVLSQEDDLAVLPGGTVQLQTGESRRFSCSNIWRQPEWVYRGNDGISVEKAEVSGEREAILLSYLDITDAEEKHSGIYECFSRTHEGHQTLSTFLHIEVVTKLENDGTPSPTSPETRVSPTESTTSTTSSEIRDNGNNPECSCEYNSGDTRVHAFVGDNQLELGDTVRHGDTVSFQCARRLVLSWENGLRYQGKARMTCSKCEVWTDRDLPTCRLLPLRSYNTLISSEEELTFLPGGILQMREGESHNISCVSARSEPEWRYETKDNIAEWISLDGKNVPTGSRRPEYYYSYLEIKHVRYDNRGKYECITATGESIVLNLEVERKSIGSIQANCSKFPDSPGLRVLYSGLSVGSTARFGCFPSPTWRTFRYSVCQEGGTWSNPAPRCEASTVRNCTKFPEYPGLRVDYSGFSVGSIARFRCFPSTRKLSGSSDSTCQQGGTWSNPAPKCEAPKCSIEDLIASLPNDATLKIPIVNNELSPGTEVELKCEKFVMERDSKAVCGEYGQWKVDNIKCIPGCRLDVNPSSKLLVEPRKDSYRVGEFVSLSCPWNYRLSNAVERLMCLGLITWSDHLPECIQEID